jgi:hypothetical protein
VDIDDQADKVSFPQTRKKLTVERFLPTLLAHAIATQTYATPKLWQEPNNEVRKNEVFY